MRRLRVSTCTWRPVSGSTSHSSPAGTSSCSRGSTISTAITPWRARSARIGPSQSRSPRKSETITTSPRWRPSAAVVLSAAPSEVAPAPSPSGSRRSSASSAEQAEAALARAQDPRLAAAEGDHAEPVAAPCRDVADGQRDALGDVGLAPVGGAEGHRGRDVEHQPGGQRALADVHAHVRLLHPGGRRSSRCGARRRPGGTGGSSPARCRRRPAASGARPARGSRSASSPRGRASAGPAAARGRGRACPASARARGRRAPLTAHLEGPDAPMPRDRRRVTGASRRARARSPRRPAAARARRRRRPTSPALLLGLGQPRAEVAVDGRQPAARRRWRRTGRRCRARCPAASAGRAGPARCWSRRCWGRCASASRPGVPSATV